jgi:outer membrane protein OmpA-like peptidoglycan-associated protein
MKRPALLLSPWVLAALLAACGTPKTVVVPTPKNGTVAPGSATGPAYGAKPAGADWSPQMQSAYDKLGSALRGSGVTVAKTNDERIWLTLPGDQAFEPNRSALKAPARAALDQVVVSLRGLSGVQLRIVGHTDSKGSPAANDTLSLDRAGATRDWMVARGMSPLSFAVAGRGARDPIADNNDEAGRAKNRRVEILISERSDKSAKR